MKKLIVLVVILVVMVMTKPTKAEYIEWFKGKAMVSIDDPIVRVIANKISDPFIESSTASQDYIVVKLFVTKIDEQNSFYAIGAFRTFVPVPEKAINYWSEKARVLLLVEGKLLS